MPKNVKNIVGCLLVMLIVLMSAAFAKNQTSVPPDNPIGEQALDVSRMLMTDKASLKLSDSIWTGLDDTDADQEEEPSDKADDPADSDFPGFGSGGGSGWQDSQKKSNKAYFITDIPDGGTIHSTDLRFTIKHLIPELKVQGEYVYVNGGGRQPFQRRVLLKEGKNDIRVAVVYTDKLGKVIPAVEDYTVYVDTGIEKPEIWTDLTDREVGNAFLTFKAFAYFNEDGDIHDLPLSVKCSDKQVAPSETDTYRLKLKSGENKIVLSASYKGHKETETYTVTYNEPADLYIATNLEDGMTVYKSHLQFYASPYGQGSEDARLTSKLRGKTLTPSKTDTDNNTYHYSVELNEGYNDISLRAKDPDGRERIDVYHIRYVPDDGNVPTLKDINVSEGKSIKGYQFTLQVWAEDYQGNLIYYNGLSVRLNRNVVKDRGVSGSYTEYDLYLKKGSNKLDIRIEDRDGRICDYTYNIQCLPPGPGGEIGTATISIDANVLGLGYLLAPTKATIYEGKPASYTLDRFLKDNGFDYKNTGTLDDDFYLARIIKTGIGVGVNIPQDLKDAINDDGLEWKMEQRDDDSLGEFDYCQGSGWMYFVNDICVGRGFAATNLKDGDVIRIRFTLAYGKDIGAGELFGSKNYPKVW